MEVSKRIVGKTEVRSHRGIVESHNEEAARAGAEAFAAGGNAFDAVIAASFTTAVRELAMNSIGGVALIVAHNARTGQTKVIDLLGRTPKGLRPDTFVPHLLPLSEGVTGFNWRLTKDRVSERGYLAVGVPGYIAAVDTLHKMGATLPLAKLVEPAIRLAEEGWEPDEQASINIASTMEFLTKFPEGRETFLPNGRIPVRGQRIVQKNLANTLREIARGGREAFYKGRIARMIVDDIRKNGGVLSMQDFAEIEPTVDEGVRGSYRGYDIVSTGMPASGTLLLEILNILEGFDIRKLGHNKAETLHLIAEAMRLAWTDRFCYGGDPEHMTVPQKGLISKEYAAELRRTIRPDTIPSEVKPGNVWAYDPAGPVGVPARAGGGGGENTTHVTAADGEGNFIALTQTLGEGFGSCVMPVGTGVMLYNVTFWMNPEPGTPNSVGPWKRQMNHGTPLLIFKGGRPWAVLGAPGGRKIPTRMAQLVMNLVDHGMSMQEAIAAPAIHTEGADPKVPAGKMI
ncbi:MAG: gamma-glutamyltransferase, partial [Chloroflexi bacterium]|nr:gamma-glutamyltransferase [Chloroflexota bacterium]